jgi:hypothetical protein
MRCLKRGCSQTYRGSGKTTEATIALHPDPVIDLMQPAPLSSKTQIVEPPRQSQCLQQKIAGGKGYGRDKGKSNLTSGTSLIKSVENITRKLSYLNLVGFFFEKNINS